jgi:hypothetical protein
VGECKREDGKYQDAKDSQSVSEGGETAEHKDEKFIVE